ncbi:MAG: arylsulfotransferase family protein [Solirubrobacteraceae bacterium]
MGVLRSDMHMLEIRLKAAFAAAFICTGLAVSSASPALAAKPIGAFTTTGAWTFHSAPKLHPPKLSTVGKTAKKLSPGDFILANFKNLGFSSPLVGQSGPMILSSRLQPIWFNPVQTSNLAMNLEVQSYNGKPALSWWQGVISGTGATVSGEDVVVGQDYRQIGKPLTGADGWIISPHEMVISGTDAWVTAYKQVPMNLVPFHGPLNGTLLDSAVQEYDLTTGALLQNWDAAQHIPLSQSKSTPGPAGTPWDAYHVNSIQLIPGGTFLVSMRNTWGAYMVDAATGNVQWTLGAGAASSFTLGPHAAFSWQHDVQLASNGQLTMFDDACCAVSATGSSPPNGPSRGLVLKLDTTAGTATLVTQFERGSKFEAAFLGSMQALPGGNALVGWGSRPYFTEYSATGSRLIDVRFPDPDQSYRVLLANWVGKPASPPSGAVRNTHGKTTVYVSWNGATQVAKWRVMAGTSGKHLRAVATAGKSGFETAITLAHGYKAYKVQALDARGHVLGTSGVFPKHKVTRSLY